MRNLTDQSRSDWFHDGNLSGQMNRDDVQLKSLVTHKFVRRDSFTYSMQDRHASALHRRRDQSGAQKRLRQERARIEPWLRCSRTWVHTHQMPSEQGSRRVLGDHDEIHRLRFYCTGSLLWQMRPILCSNAALCVLVNRECVLACFSSAFWR